MIVDYSKPRSRHIAQIVPDHENCCAQQVSLRDHQADIMPIPVTLMQLSSYVCNELHDVKSVYHN